MTDTAATRIDRHDDIAVITFDRPQKRNAMNDALIAELDAFFSNPPKDVRAVVITGAGGHFCSGLDLSEHQHRSPEETVYHSRNWHRVADLIEFGGLPVIAALTEPSNARLIAPSPRLPTTSILAVSDRLNNSGMAAPEATSVLMSSVSGSSVAAWAMVRASATSRSAVARRACS